MANESLSVTLDHIRQARERFRENERRTPLVRTPCVRSGYFSELTGRNLYFKLENMQRTGSFKERGALNRLLTLTPEERRCGVIAASAGNHAQGVAYHAQNLGISAKIVMPTTTPEIKRANTGALGASVVIHGVNYDQSMAHARKLAKEEGRVLIHPFDDPDVIAGQGTLGLELLEECSDVDAVLVSIGGGGLIAGIATAVRESRPDVRIIGVESTARDAAFRSRRAGERVSLDDEQMRRETIADGIAVQQIGEHTFPLIEAYVERLVTVEESRIAEAIFALVERQKTVVEGACAVTLAAMLDPVISSTVEGQNVVLLLSGGNIDVNLLSRITERCMTQSRRLAYLRVLVPDRPGRLAAVTEMVGRHGANILQLGQRHGVGNQWVTEAEVDLTLETRGPEHVLEVIGALRDAGYGVMDETEGRPWH